jgi:gamma-glutamyltranspeptidase / glutathione hydrolase
MRAAVAAGHPATTAAGVEILSDGGSAADAAVAACLASCVAETVMTGFLGGGYCIYFDAATSRARNLDCFVAAPGIGGTRSPADLVELDVPFGEELVHYAVGVSSCGVPGLPAGIDELWRWYGRLPWDRLVEPALSLARAGVRMPRAHASCLAMLAPVMTMDAGAGIYSPGGRLLAEGDRLDQPGLVDALETIAAEGAKTVYAGSLADALLDLIDERDGAITPQDLDAYRADWSDPVAVEYAGTRFLTRSGLSGIPETIGRLPRFRRLDEAARAVAWAEALGAEPLVTSLSNTTNLTVLDADGNACAFTTSLGLGSGDYLPGLDLHLNSMLGEAELIRGPIAPGARVGSMMAPSLAVDDAGLALVVGAAGGTRLRGALLQSVAGVLDEGLRPWRAIERPRIHRIGTVVHVEPGWSEEAVAALTAAGYEVKVWPEPHHYFGGVSMIGRRGAAADPRRSGEALSV